MLLLRSLAAALALCCLVCVAAPAAAQRAENQFVEAKRLYDLEEYDAALSVFRLAFESTKSPNARLYMGRCMLKLDRLLPAYEELHATLFDAAEMAKQDEKYLATRDAAAAELALLEPRIGRVVITPDVATPMAQITLDDAPFPADKHGELVAVLPGKHSIEASAPDRLDFSREIEVSVGKTVAIAVALTLPSGQAPPVPLPPRSDPRTSAMQIIGAITVAVGGAVLVLAAASGAAAASRFSALEQACGGQRCGDESFASVVDTGKRFETLAYIGLGVGGAAVIAGTVLIVAGAPSDEAEASAGLSPLPGGAMLRYRSSF